MGRIFIAIGILAGALALVFAWRGPDAAPSTAAASGPGPGGSSARPDLRPAEPPVSSTRDALQPVAPKPGPAAPEVELVSVRVITAASYARKAERIPNIAVRLLAARAEFAPRGSPMQSAALHPDDPALWSGRTGDAGEVLAELPEGSFGRDADGRPLLLAQVVEPGHQQRVGRVRAAALGAGEPPQLTVMAVRGATARGRVVDAEGRGLAADVRLRLWKSYSGVTKLSGGAGTRQLVDGWFELDLREDFRGGVLIADAGERGTGTLQDVDLLLDRPARDLVLVVRGPGRLRGRVVDDVGTPAASVELLFWLAEFDDEFGSFVSPEPLHSQRTAEGGGRLWVTGQTGADGRFDVGGLRAGPYVVRARTGQGRQSGYPRLLTRLPVPADGSELELVLSRPHLAVRLLSEDGGDWEGAAAGVHAPNFWHRPLSSWPAGPKVVVYACESDQGADVPRGSPLLGRVASADEVIYEVPPDARYLVGAMGAGFSGELRAVDVPPNAGRVAVELVAPSSRELGAVSVRVVHAGAELDGRRTDEPEFDVLLESLDSGAILLARERWGEPAPFVFSAPAGRYRVAVEGVPFVESQHGVLMTERVLGRAEVELELVARTTRELTLEVGLGARLELSLEGAPDESDREAAREGLGESEDEAELTRAASLAEVVLLRPGRRSETLQRTIEWTMTSAAGTHLESRWPLGEQHLSQVVQQGTVTVLVRLPGGREVRTRVELRAGETTALKLRL